MNRDMLMSYIATAIVWLSFGVLIHAAKALL